MNRIALTIAAALSAIPAGAVVPHKAYFPEVPGYVTLRGDFHIHTVFSDDTTWPTVRVDEAVYDGLDFISMTDHCEARLRKQVLNGTFNGETVDANTSTGYHPTTERNAAST